MGDYDSYNTNLDKVTAHFRTVEVGSACQHAADLTDFAEQREARSENMADNDSSDANEQQIVNSDNKIDKDSSDAYEQHIVDSDNKVDNDSADANEQLIADSDNKVDNDSADANEQLIADSAEDVGDNVAGMDNSDEETDSDESCEKDSTELGTEVKKKSRKPKKGMS